MARSLLEEHMVLSFKAHAVPEYVREYRFHPTRDWRMDFAWPEHKVALEVEGGIWVKGAHVRGKRFTEDCVKYNEAALMGWCLLRVTTNQVKSGDATQLVLRAETGGEMRANMKIIWYRVPDRKYLEAIYIPWGEVDCHLTARNINEHNIAVLCAKDYHDRVCLGVEWHGALTFEILDVDSVFTVEVSVVKTTSFLAGSVSEKICKEGEA